MPIVLYHFLPSPPSRLAFATAKAIGVNVTTKVVDLFGNGHLKEEYVKINPEHTIPTLDDNGFIIWDSHAIATYLVSQYGKDDSLYPKEPKKRALVDQRLYFNATSLFARMRATAFPVLFLGKTDVETQNRDAIYETLGNLEKYVGATGWVAGDHASLADIACATTATSLQEMGVDLSAYTKIHEWLQRCYNNIPSFEEVNRQGAKDFGEAFRSHSQPNVLAR